MEYESGWAEAEPPTDATYSKKYTSKSWKIERDYDYDGAHRGVTSIPGLHSTTLGQGFGYIQ